MHSPPARIAPSCFWLTPTVACGLALACSASIAAIYWPSSAPASASAEGGLDLIAYRHIVERVHEGQSYYDAAGEELRAGGYCSSSVFNWRLPTYAWLLGSFYRHELGQVLLCALALLAMFLAFDSERKQSNVGRAVMLVLLMLGAMTWCVDGDAYFAQELWAGVLIALSVGAFASDWRMLGICAGMAALFFRELAIVYVVACCWAAWRDRKKDSFGAYGEIAAWSGGLVAFVLFYLWHAAQVRQHLTGMELAEAEGWIQFGGLAFVVRTSQMNAWLFNLPGWIAALYLAASLWGLWCWTGSTADRVTTCVVLYLAAFLIVGKPFNVYWGLLYVSLLPFGLVRCLSRSGKPSPALSL